MGSDASSDSMVTASIDGREVTVEKGTNIIKAAEQLGIEIPFYCYHPHLSVPGNCRICQVEVEGAPKLMIGCHTQVQDGMVVRTHNTSESVKSAQASIMELLLINHPLDCTVCDQAGHCKLQDYHYQYNAKASRFIENKEHKVKAEPLGPTVVLDGERCIACTRCVRFCDEITETGELGLLNRGDQFVIAVKEGKELNNPLSGTVVDLCPVGALTHRDWRFNTRIWYAEEHQSICPGCSTGCNVRVFSRDDQIVQVKARLNAEVNKEWLCDEGRYGFHRFLPESRVLNPTLDGESLDLEAALKKAAGLKGKKCLVFVAPDLLLEEYALLGKFLEKYAPGSEVAVSYRERKLSQLEQILVSPDYAPNFMGAQYSGLLPQDLEPAQLQERYEAHLKRLLDGEAEALLLVGDRAIEEADRSKIADAISQVKLSVGFFCDAASILTEKTSIVMPGRSILEKSGLFINRGQRLQYVSKARNFPDGTLPEWRIINQLANACGASLVKAVNDREATLAYLREEQRLAGLKIKNIRDGGVCLRSYRPRQPEAGVMTESRPSA